MKILQIIIFIVMCSGLCRAQEIVERKNKLTSDVSEKYQSVIEADRQVKQGTYAAYFSKKTLIAAGNYDKDKRIGKWRFFDMVGDVAQEYDYTNHKLTYEAPDDKSTRIRYQVDYIIRDTDVVTKPVRLGGRYFGYIPYLRLFALPKNLSDINPEATLVVLELLISPMGRVADVTAHIKYNGQTSDIGTVNIATDRLSDEDKTFIAATFNKKPISSRIFISCYMNRFDEIGIY